MGYVIPFFVQRYLPVLTLFIVFFSTSAYSNEDLYLKELEAEIGGAQTSGVVSADPAKVITLDPKQLEKKDFEEKLANELPTTFRTYKMLSAEDKMKVFEMYASNEKNMKKATRLLFELYYK